MALSAGIVITNYFTLTGARESTLKSVEDNLLSQTVALSEETNRSFKVVDLALSIVAERVAQRNVQDGISLWKTFADIETHQWLRESSAGMPHVYGISIADDRGKIVNASRSWPVPDVDISDRDYFQHLKNNSQLETFVGQPVANRATGTWAIFLARRLNNPHGEFMGVALGVISLTYFEGFFKSIFFRDGSGAALVRDDGMLLAYHPPNDAVGTRVFAPRDPASRGDGTASIDRIPHAVASNALIVASKPVAHYPLRIFASQDEETALRDWRALSFFSNLIAGGSALLVTLLAATAFVTLRKQDTFNSELAEKHYQLDTALTNMTTGLCLYDRDNRLVLCNEKYRQIYRLPRELVRRGTHVKEILGYSVSAQLLTPDASALIEHSIEALGNLRLNTTTTHTRELTDGRVISIVRQPTPDGGWLAVHEDISQRRRSEEKVLHMARHDALTDLPNRALLRERLDFALKGHARSGRKIAVLMIDLDRFKDVNDTLGHPTGDELLKAVGTRLRACVRETTTIARLGGDEFAIVEEVCDPAVEATALAERVGRCLSQPFEIQEQQVLIGSSIGIAVGPDDGANPDALLKNSDLALYRVKSEGRGAHRFFEPEMDRRMQARRDLEHDLRSALAEGQFELHFQPIVNLTTGEMVSSEALLRWIHPVRGMVRPADFVGLAEETGLIAPIGQWVIETACRTAASWAKPLAVAVNISAAQFRGTGLTSIVTNALARSGLCPSRLELEITETVLMEESEAAFSTLRELHDLGVQISLDDFGTGCSSLSHLRRFTFDKIKIDRSFVTELADAEPTSLAIVRSLIQLAGSLGKKTTAEGVETQELYDLVRKEGCTEMQGYFFSKPLTAAEIDRLIENGESAKAA